MLSTVLILLACVAGIVSAETSYAPKGDEYSQYAPTKDAYGQSHDYGYDNDIQRLLQKLSTDIQATFAADKDLVERLIGLRDENTLNTALVDNFFDRLFPDLRKRQANQSEEISELERQGEALLLLIDDVATINSTLQEVRRQAYELAKESAALEAEAQELAKVDSRQEYGLAAVKARLAEQARQLSRLEKETTAFQEKLNSSVALVNELTEVVDKEQGVQVIRTLTSEDASVRQVLPLDFAGDTPLVQYGFSNIYIQDDSHSYAVPNIYGSTYGSKGYDSKGYDSKGYDSKGYDSKGYDSKGYGSKGYDSYGTPYQNASINFQIDVAYEAETNEVILSALLYSSGGWSVAELTVSATIISIDNQIFQVEKQPAPKY